MYRHPLAAVGGALIVAGGLIFVLLVIRDVVSPDENPYRALVTFVGIPAVITIGAVLFAWSLRLQTVAARKRGEKLRFSLRVEPTDATYMRNLWLFLGLSVVLLVGIGLASFRAYEATDSTDFCGAACHGVMGPQFIAYEHGAHAQVPCIDCHIGPGAAAFVEAKLNGTRQLIETLRGTYDRPIETPVPNLRPAAETCGECHSTDVFSGETLFTHTYFDDDEENTPWTVSLIVKIGGTNPLTGEPEGAHWHITEGNTVEYFARDHERNEIEWVRVTRNDGSTSTFTPSGALAPVGSADGLETRVMDCTDCHNHPAHEFRAPGRELDEALASGEIDTDLPFIKRLGLELLNAPYEDTESAEVQIADGIAAFYRERYPTLMESRWGDVDRATSVILEIYGENFFPEMKSDYRVRQDNLGHLRSPACFRCHTPDMADDEGRSIPSDCNTCHTIISQGESAEPGDLETDLGGLEFVHPAPIGDRWRNGDCISCHDDIDNY